MTAHSSILAWEIAWTEGPGGLQSMGLQELDSINFLLRTVFAASMGKFFFFFFPILLLIG